MLHMHTTCMQWGRDTRINTHKDWPTFACVTPRPPSCRPASHTSFQYHTPASVGDTHQAPWQPHLSASISTTVGETRVVLCSNLSQSAVPSTRLLCRLQECWEMLHSNIIHCLHTQEHWLIWFLLLVSLCLLLLWGNISANNLFYLEAWQIHGKIFQKCLVFSICCHFRSFVLYL